MTAEWYYSSDDTRLGPFSQHQLKQFAACGVLLPTDTVWKEGTATGVAASRVKNLFPALDAANAAEAAAPADAAPAVVENETPIAPKYQSPKKPPAVTRMGSATAIKGADIVGQDGFTARYRMKCIECGHKDSSCRTVRIMNKTLTTTYFCPKCRKKRAVVVQCRGG